MAKYRWAQGLSDPVGVRFSGGLGSALAEMMEPHVTARFEGITGVTVEELCKERERKRAFDEADRILKHNATRCRNPYADG